MCIRDRDQLDNLYGEIVATTFRGRPIRCKTLGQREYVRAIRRNTLTFGVGPAGTGKTYLAMAMAVAALKSKEVERIVLTRPAVEAGEKLGFLPGDLNQKVDPYLRPLYDCLLYTSDQTADRPRRKLSGNQGAERGRNGRVP